MIETKLSFSDVKGLFADIFERYNITAHVEPVYGEYVKYGTESTPCYAIDNIYVAIESGDKPDCISYANWVGFLTTLRMLLEDNGDLEAIGKERQND